MTHAQAKAFIAKWSAVLAPEWDIELIDGPDPTSPASDHYAATEVDGDYLRARIFLHEVAEAEDDEARKILLHELIHLTIKDLELTALTPLSALGVESGALAKATLDRSLERTVDRLAIAFAKLQESSRS